MLSSLPTTLLLLLLALPVFSSDDNTTTPYDPFRQIILNSPKKPGPPVCCLKPLTPQEPVDDEFLVSFEEWKARQLAVQANETMRLSDLNATNNVSGSSGGEAHDRGGENETIVVLPAVPIPPAEPAVTNDPSTAGLLPHIRVPLTDRFNYASVDCSARVHAAHRGAKSPASILTSKKDRYMLSPCNIKGPKFVVIELCDDIRIDTVQLANFEFFSGVFKEFSVSVAKTYEEEAWVPVGTFRGKNVRGVQSFHPPLSLRDFYRFLRIDFHSHYGNEYYCPVSLLRVYGLTHLEEWKLEIWEKESRERHAEIERLRHTRLSIAGSDTASNPPPPASTVNIDVEVVRSTPPIESSNVSTTSPTKISSSPPLAESSGSNPPNTISTTPNHISTPPSNPTMLADASSTSMSSIQSSDVSNTSTVSVAVRSVSTSFPDSNPNSSIKSVSKISDASPSVVSVNPPAAPTIILPASPGTASIALPPPLTAKGGESVYRTIMNRLLAIDANHTLYVRYVEQQHASLREIIKRLGEDIGRLEGLNRAQGLNLDRTLLEWEEKKYQWTMAHADLRERVDSLAEEIILEKRLSIAQLCLLLAVLVFLGLTRGSRVDNLAAPRPSTGSSFRQWGRRHLSLSGDWRKPIPREPSPEILDEGPKRTPARPKPVTAHSYPGHYPRASKENIPPSHVDFPVSPFEAIELNTAPVQGDFGRRTRTSSNPRSRVPSLRTTPVRRPNVTQPRPMTPTKTSLRHGLQRSNSHGGTLADGIAYAGSGLAPRSAKKWARTAHLHEVKSSTSLPNNLAKETKRRVASRSPMKPSPKEVVELPPQTVDGLPRPSSRHLLLGDLGFSGDDGDAWIDTDSGSEFGFGARMDSKS